MTIAWYDPTNHHVSTDKNDPLFTPLGQLWPLVVQTEHETNLRDLAAMFALTGLLARNDKGIAIVPIAFDIANEFMLARNPTPEDGIAGLKPKRRKTNEQE